MIKFEYRMIKFGKGELNPESLNGFSEKGWELVCVHFDIGIFKRPIKEEIDTNE